MDAGPHGLHPATARHAALPRLRSALSEDAAVRWAYLFGSAARGEPFRDLDVGVVLDPVQGRGAVRFGSLVSALESAVPDIRIDVVDLGSAAPAVRGMAVREGILLFDREPLARREWEIHVTRIWLDLEPWIQRGEALRLEALRERAR